MRKPLSRLLLALTLVILYVFIAPVGSRGELLLEHAWSTPIAGAAVPANRGSDGGEAVPFVLGARFGYVTPSGRIMHSGVASHGVALGDSRFSSYPQRPDLLAVQAADGSFIGSMPGNAYPILSGDSIFTIGSDQRTISAYTPELSLAWRSRIGGLVTVLDAKNGRVAVGTAGGDLLLLDEKGEEVFAQKPRAGEFRAAYAVALSPDAQRLAAIVGLFPQELVVLEQVESEMVVVFRQTLGSSFRRPVLLTFADSQATLLAESEQGLLVVDLARSEITEVPMLGPARWASDSVVDGLLAAGASDTGGSQSYQVALFSPQGTTVATFDYRATDASFDRVGQELYLGADESIVMIRLTEG